MAFNWQLLRITKQLLFVLLWIVVVNLFGLAFSVKTFGYIKCCFSTFFYDLSLFLLKELKTHIANFKYLKLFVKWRYRICLKFTLNYL